MSGKPKYLRNRKTGVVFRYNAHLLKRNRDMEPYNGPGAKPVFDEVDATGGLPPDDDEPGVILDDKGTTAGAGLTMTDANGSTEKPARATGVQNEDQGQGAEAAATGTEEPLMIGDVSLDEATKDQMVEFAKTAFGVTLAKQMKEENMRAELRKLLTE